jgi:lysophospholipid acyltransferase (LPLAT)-like uncharacterized protein
MGSWRTALSRFLQQFISFLGYLYIQFVFKTSRWTWMGEENIQPFWHAGKPVIVCFWHNRLLMMPYVWRTKRPFYMLMSSHGDGELIARIVGYLGIQWTQGSSSKGGAAAFRALFKNLKEGRSIGITPDGPRGPLYHVEPGIARLSLRTGIPIFPCSFSTQRHRFLKTWDRFCLAFPFTRGVLIWGAPLDPVAYGSEQDLIAAIRNQLMDITQTADRLCGAETPLPSCGQLLFTDGSSKKEKIK